MSPRLLVSQGLSMLRACRDGALAGSNNSSPAGRVAMLLLGLLVATSLFLPARSEARSQPGLRASLVGESPNGGGVFRFPQAIAVTARGDRVFVGDQYSGIIQAFDRNGRFLFSFGGRATRGERGRLGIVGGVAVDRSGHVFVLDSEFDRIQVFTARSGRFITSFGNSRIFDLASGIANAGGISASGIAAWQKRRGSSPVLFVADQGLNRVARIKLNPRTLRPARRPRFTNKKANLNNPQGLAVSLNGKRLYVADDFHHRIAVIDARKLKLVGQFGSFGSGRGQFHDPFDVAVDAQRPNRIYVADNLNNRVDVFSEPLWRSVGTWGSFGRRLGGFSIVRALASPTDDPSGGVLVADTANNRIQHMNARGAVTSAWGIAGRSQGYFTRPRAVAVDRTGGVSVADSFAHRVARFAADGTYLSDFGRIVEYHGYAIAGRALGQLRFPAGIAYDARGIAWIADSGNKRIQGIDPATGKVRYRSARGVFRAPKAVGAGPDGSVLISDLLRGRVLQLSAKRKLKVLRRGLDNPTALAWDGGEKIYVAESSRITDITTGKAVPPPPGARKWNYPSGLAVDPASGILYVAERRLSTARGARVLRGMPIGRRFYWDVIAREGTGWGKVIEPAGLALSAGGQALFVADSGNNRVWRFHPASFPPPPRRQLLVSVSPQSRGLVTSRPGGISCPTDCTQRIGQGRTVTLSAEALPGHFLERWTGACSGHAPTCAVKVDEATSVGAIFARVGTASPIDEPKDPKPEAPPRPGVRVTNVTLSTRILYLPRKALKRRKSARHSLPASKAKVQLTLSRPATVTVTVQALRPGSGWRMLPLWRNLRLLPGRRSFILSRNFMGRRLPRGRYRLVINAIDWNANRIQPRVRSFEVRRRPQPGKRGSTRGRS